MFNKKIKIKKITKRITPWGDSFFTTHIKDSFKKNESLHEQPITVHEPNNRFVILKLIRHCFTTTSFNETRAKMDQKPQTQQEDDSISGYLHNVSPIKTSRKNNRYFNATLQVSRDEYHNTVVFATEKHDTLNTAATNKTPIKMKNARKTISKYKLTLHLTNIIDEWQNTTILYFVSWMGVYNLTDQI